jgi:uncharacterized protein YehS (DUF1456 family)
MAQTYEFKYYDKVSEGLWETLAFQTKEGYEPLSKETLGASDDEIVIRFVRCNRHIKVADMVKYYSTFYQVKVSIHQISWAIRKVHQNNFKEYNEANGTNLSPRM